MSDPFDSGTSGISLALDVPFPANVTSGPGIKVDKTTGNWVVSLDYPPLVDGGIPATPSNIYLAAYDVGVPRYERLRLDNLIAGATGLDGRTPIGDANYAVIGGSTPDRYIGLTATLTAIRTITLPAANTIPAGRLVVVQDEAGGISGAFHHLFSPTGADTIDGLPAWRNKIKYGAVTLRCNGTNAWNVISTGQLTTVADTNYTVQQGDLTVAYTSISAARTVTLPAASVYPYGQRLTIIDVSGSCSLTNVININRVSTDTINGAISQTIAAARGYIAIISDGVGKWTITDTSSIGSIAGVPITGASIDNSPIGATTPSTGVFTTLSATTITATPIGAPTPAAGTFTTLAATAVSAATLVLTGGGFKVGGRLTLDSSGNIPVMSAAITGSALYWVPYDGNLVPLWNGTQFVWTACSQLSNIFANSAVGNAGPAAAAVSQVYDLYIWSNAGTPTLTRSPPWSAGTAGSNTVRGTGAGGSALARVNGILTNVVAITNGPAAGAGTYVGTILMDSGGATVTFTPGSSAANGGQAWIGVWNQFNRVTALCNVNDSTVSHTYTTATYRAWNNSNTNRITVVAGQVEDGVQASFISRWAPAATGSFSNTGIGLDSTSTLAASAVQAQNSAASPSTAASGQLNSVYAGYPGLGVHFLQALEQGDGTNANTFVGGPQEAFTATLRY